MQAARVRWRTRRFAHQQRQRRTQASLRSRAKKSWKACHLLRPPSHQGAEPVAACGGSRGRRQRQRAGTTAWRRRAPNGCPASAHGRWLRHDATIQCAYARGCRALGAADHARGTEGAQLQVRPAARAGQLQAFMRGAGSIGTWPSAPCVPPPPQHGVQHNAHRPAARRACVAALLYMRHTRAISTRQERNAHTPQCACRRCGGAGGIVGTGASSDGRDRSSGRHLHCSYARPGGAKAHAQSPLGTRRHAGGHARGRRRLVQAGSAGCAYARCARRPNGVAPAGADRDRKAYAASNGAQMCAESGGRH